MCDMFKLQQTNIKTASTGKCLTDGTMFVKALLFQKPLNQCILSFHCPHQSVILPVTFPSSVTQIIFLAAKKTSQSRAKLLHIHMYCTEIPDSQVVGKPALARLRARPNKKKAAHVDSCRVSFMCIRKVTRLKPRNYFCALIWQLHRLAEEVAF